MVLCLVLSPGDKSGQLVNLRKEENVLTNKTENQKFLIIEPPAIEFTHNYKPYPVYVCDSAKGVTVGLSFDREKELASMFSDPRMFSNVFDETFISRATNIKTDFKQLIGVALFSVFFGWVIGLMF